LTQRDVVTSFSIWRAVRKSAVALERQTNRPGPKLTGPAMLYAVAISYVRTNVGSDYNKGYNALQDGKK
jgi:hypothetical protein